MAPADLLVLGASGRVGRLLRRFWPEGPGKVLWVSRQAAAGVTLWQPGDALPAAHAVLVLAGVTRGTEAELERNSTIAEDLGQAIAAMGAEAAFFASTMAVYGQTRPGGAVEGDGADAPRPYGAAKRRAEAAFLAALGPVQGTALRLGNVVGADLLGDMVAEGRPITLDQFAGGGGPLRSYLGPRQLARVVAGLAQHRFAAQDLPPALNVAAPEPVDMADLLRAAEIPFNWRPAPEGAMPLAHMRCDLLAHYLPPLPGERDLVTLAADWRKAMTP